MPKTPNHDYNVPEQGAKDWHEPLNANFRQYDTDIEIRDADGNKGDYEPKPGAKFLATDTGLVYEGDGSNWILSLAASRATGASTSGAAANLVAGHPNNSIGNQLSGATIAGGGRNQSPHEVTGDFGTVGGGVGNRAGAKYTTVAGGFENTADINTATIAGGGNNTANGGGATVTGGVDNTAESAMAAVSGGEKNTASGNGATVAGGVSNTAGGRRATIAGGLSSDAPGNNAAVGGGRDHNASGDYSTVPGGQENLARENYSFAAGRKAKARAVGSFVWGDSSSQFIESLTEDEVVFQAGGGLTMWTESDLTKGLQVDSGDGGVEMRTINGGNLHFNSGDISIRSQADQNTTFATTVEGLEVSGSGDEYTFRIIGNLNVSGSKNFVQSVDTDDGEQEVVYTASEAPTPRTEASGVAELEDGRAEIELPDHFGWVTDDEEPIHVQTTPYSADSGGLAAVERSPDRVVVEDLDGEGDYEFSYTVRGTRDGYADKEVVREPSGEEPNAQQEVAADD